MSNQDFKAPIAKHVWRHAFRQHALDVDPFLGEKIPRSVSTAAEEHWLLREPLLRSIIVGTAIDLRELGRWNGAFADLDNQALLRHAVDRIGMTDAAQPTSFSEYVPVLAKLVLASLREIIATKRQIAGAKRHSRRRGTRTHWG